MDEKTKTTRKRVRANVKEFVDQDYREKLSPEDRDYLDRFNSEYYLQSKPKEGGLLTPEQQAERTAADDARRRDFYSPTRDNRQKRERSYHKQFHTNQRVSVDTLERNKSYQMEDAMIRVIDHAKRKRGGK